MRRRCHRRGLSPRRCAALLLSSLLGAAPVACGVERPPAGPGVLLLTIDALRADRLGHAGGRSGVSPTIDALAARGIVFERAYSESGWTLPSVASLLTGLPPHRHGATRFTRSLASGVPTLASLLSEHGYDTRAYVSHVLLRPRYGIDRGFRTFDHSVLELGDPHGVSSAAALTDRVLGDLDRRPIEGPFLLWIHYFDPHYAYLSHPSYAHFGTEPRDRYDGEIAHTDSQIGRLTRELRERGLDEELLVVFTADHGEEFGDHGGELHDTLHDEIVRIPLILRVPGRPPQRRRDPARQIDVVPTVLGALGIPAPPGLPGRDLLEPPPPDAALRPVFFERDVPSRYRQRGIQLGDEKLLVVEPVPADQQGSGPFAEPEPQPSLQPGIRLYDLRLDPRERRDRAGDDPETLARMLADLRAHFDRDDESATGSAVELDPELGQRLRSLGYLE